MSDDEWVFDPKDDYDISDSEIRTKKRKAKSGKKKKSKYKKLTSAKKKVAKSSAKKKAKLMLPSVGFFYIPLTVNFSNLYIFGTVNVLSVFADPVGCPSAEAAGYWRGGKQLRVILGPRPQGIIKGDPKTYKLPNALTEARSKFPGHGFVSGHMLNGEMGGQGGDESHVTILSHNANMAQKTFDQAIKRAQYGLHQFYAYLGTLMPLDGQGFIDNMGYGIRVTITMSDATWGAAYPRNCISSTMTLNAVIVKEPDLDNWLVPTNFENIKSGAKAFLKRKIEEVRDEVNAVDGHVVNNP